MQIQNEPLLHLILDSTKRDECHFFGKKETREQFLQIVLKRWSNVQDSYKGWGRWVFYLFFKLTLHLRQKEF